jgi:hypothetical protein
MPFTVSIRTERKVRQGTGNKAGRRHRPGFEKPEGLPCFHGVG